MTPTFRWANNNTNENVNEVVQLSALVEDSDTLSMIIASWNGSSTGAWINVSNITPSNTANNYSINVSVGLARGSTVGWVFYSNDSVVNTFTASTLNTFVVADTTPSFTLANNNTNAKVNEVVQLSTLVNDADTISMIIASWNGSSAGAWINISNITLSSTANNYSVNVSVGLDTGKTVGWLFYSNDSVVNTFTVSDLNTFVVADRTAPVVNTTFNVTSAAFNDVINFSGNITDDLALLSANITYNMSGVVTYANYTISSTSASIENTTAITGCVETCVINFTMYVADRSNNVRQNSTLIVIRDVVPPVVNTTFNMTNFMTSVLADSALNYTANITDETGLLSANWTMEGLPSGKIFANYTLSGTSAQVSNVTA